MSQHDHKEDKTQEQPRTEGGPTAPQDVDNPGERTSPAGNEEPDRERLEHAREDQERTIAS